MDQGTLKLLKKLTGKSRKIMCNYNSKLRHTHTKEVKSDKNINIEGVSKNGNDFRMGSNFSDYQLKKDCYPHSLVK